MERSLKEMAADKFPTGEGIKYFSIRHFMVQSLPVDYK